MRFFIILLKVYKACLNYFLIMKKSDYILVRKRGVIVLPKRLREDFKNRRR